MSAARHSIGSILAIVEDEIRERLDAEEPARPRLGAIANHARVVLEELGKLTGQLDVVRAERDQARADLEALRASLKPARLSPMTAARLEADLVVYKLEEQVIDATVAYVRGGHWLGSDVRKLVGELQAARAAAEKIGGGS